MAARKKTPTRKKTTAKTNSASKSPKKRAAGAKSTRSKSGKPKPSTKKRTAGDSTSGTRRPFSLTAKQAATLQAKLSDCAVTWGLEVRTGDDWVEVTGKTALAEHDAWLFNSREGLIGGERSIEGFELGVSFDKRITALPSLAALSSLGVSRLNAAGSILERKSQVTDISSIGTLKGLKSLDLSHCTKLEDFSPLSALKNLESLRLTASAKLEKSSDLAGLKSLRSLDLAKCARLSDVSSLSGLKRLETLNLSGCDALADVSDLAGLKALKHLDLSKCVKLADISGLGKLKALQSLDISGCPKLTDISELARLKDLRVLKLSSMRGYDELADISIVTKLKSLQHLELNYLKSRSDVSDLSGLKNLQRLFLSGCTALVDVSALSGLQKLRILDLSSCPNLDDLSPLAELQSLETIRLGQCTALTEVSHLSGLTKLQTVNLKACGNIRDLESLSSCESLRTLTWNEEPACHDVLAACAARRLDVAQVEEKCKRWLESFPSSKKPDRMARRLVECFGLGDDDEWAAEALENLIDPARTEHKEKIQAETWARWAEKVLALGDPALRDPIEKALKAIDPEHEITPLMDPVLTALADALPGLDADARDWARQQVEEVLAPHAGKPEQERKAAPAAVVFYMALDPGDTDGHIKEWLDRGTVPKAPIWRDKVRLAVIKWQLNRGDDVEKVTKLEGALRELRRIQSRKYQDLAHKTLVRHFDLFDTPTEALTNHLEAIKDDGTKVSVAKELADNQRATGEPGNLSALLLALQDDREALAALMERLLAGQHDVADAIRRAFAEDSREQVANRLAELNLKKLDGDTALSLVTELKTLIDGSRT